MDTQTQIERLIELAIIQRSELKRLVDELPQLREHLSSEIEKTFEDAEPQLRAELEEFIEKRATDATAKTGAALEAKIKELSSNLEISTQARFNAIIAEREQNARLAAEAEAKIAEHAASLPSAVKDIVTAELARFPRAGEIDQLRKEFAEPRGLNPRGKWQAGETYNKLDLVTINGDSYTSNTDGNRTRPSRSSADWTLVAARGTGGGGGPTSLSELTTVPSDGDLLIGSGTSWVTSNLTAGAGISITVGPGAITISATDGDITLDDGTAASPSLHFTNDPDTGIYRPAANTLGISVSGTQVAYFNENGLTVPSAGVVAGGSFHGANGNANNPSFSFTSDQDTGFYRHGTNELGISIGGTEKAVMTSTTFSITPNVSTSGNLTVSGTGTSTFSGPVTLSNTASTASYQTGLRLSSTVSSAPNTVQSLEFYSSSLGVAMAAVDALRESGSYASSLRFWSTTGPGVLTENMRLTSGGNLGIGTTTPDPTSLGGRVLTLSGDFTRARLQLRNTDSSSVGSVAGTLQWMAGSTSLATIDVASETAANTAYLAFSTSASGTIAEAMRISATNRNLLIGTTTDGGQKLQVSGSGIFGNTTGASTTTPVNLSLGGTYGTTYANGIKLSVFDGGGTKHGLGVTSGVLYLATSDTATTIQLATNNTTALTLDSSQNATFAGNVFAGGQVKSTITSDYCFNAGPTGGADRNLVVFGVSGVTNGMTVKWNNATGTIRVNIQNLPTSATGLAAGDIWNDSGTLKIA